MLFWANGMRCQFYSIHIPALSYCTDGNFGDDRRNRGYGKVDKVHDGAAIPCRGGITDIAADR